MDDIEKPLFKLENVIVHEKKKETEKMEPVHIALVSLGNAEAEYYLTEIAMLHRKLHERQPENKYLQEACRNAKNAEKGTQELVNKLQSEWRVGGIFELRSDCWMAYNLKR